MVWSCLRSAGRTLLLPAALLASLCSPVLAAGALDAESLRQPLTTIDARHLLVRTGFGVRADRLTALTGISRADAIDRIVAGLGQAPGVPPPDWVRAPAPRFHARGDLDDEARRAFDAARERELVELRLWWVRAMLESPSPQTERLVLFWHDHFATSYYGINRQTIALARQQQTFRELGTRSFRDLLKAMIRDPALLNFLDAPSNRKTAPNENLGRELLELFTLGEGQYDERTVKMAARALTGHASNYLRDLEFRINWGQRDTGEKTLFGRTGPFDGDALIDIILEQPAAARFLATRFWHAYITDGSPDPETIGYFADVLRQSDYDIATLYRALLESEAFWAAEHRATLVKSPVHLLIGLTRTLERPGCHWRELPSLLDELGMALFAPPDVSGWQEGAAFVTPGRLLNRYRAVEALMADCDAQAEAPVEGRATADMLAGGMHEPVATTGSALPPAAPQGLAAAEIRVGAVRVQGASVHPEHGTRTLALALENVQTPAAYVHTLLFRLHEVNAQRLDLRIGSGDCWPDCLLRWPDCAWKAKHDPKLRTVAFPLDRATDATSATLRCQYEALHEADRRLVDSLWTAAPGLLRRARLGNRAQRFAEALDHWEATLAARRTAIRQGVYAARAYPLVLAAQGAPDSAAMSAPSSDAAAGTASRMPMAGMSQAMRPEPMTASTYDDAEQSAPASMAATMLQGGSMGAENHAPARHSPLTKTADSTAEQPPVSDERFARTPGTDPIDPIDLLLPGIEPVSLLDPAQLPDDPDARIRWVLGHPAFQVY